MPVKTGTAYATNVPPARLLNAAGLRPLDSRQPFALCVSSTGQIRDLESHLKRLVGSKGKALGRTPQSAKLPMIPKAQKGAFQKKRLPFAIIFLKIKNRLDFPVTMK